MDLMVVALTIALFAASVLFVTGCEKLGKSS